MTDSAFIEELIAELRANRQVLVHGDEIISGVRDERPEARPKCGYKITKTLATGGTTREACSSEEELKSVSGHSRTLGTSTTTPVCNKHLPNAIKDWNWDTIDPL